MRGGSRSILLKHSRSLEDGVYYLQRRCIFEVITLRLRHMEHMTILTPIKQQGLLSIQIEHF